MAREIKRRKMYPSSILNPEKSQCALWAAKGRGPTSVQKMFRTRLGKCAAACETSQRWSRKYHDPGTHALHGGTTRAQITTEQNDKIRDLFSQAPKISLGCAAVEKEGWGNSREFSTQRAIPVSLSWKNWDQAFQC